MSNQYIAGYQQTRSSTRVADYFLVVGASDDFELDDASPPGSSAGDEGGSGAHASPCATDLMLKPHVLSRYPTADRDDVQFPEGIFLFCHPRGLSISDHALSPSFHSFVHTSESGARVFGCCLTIFEKMNEGQRAVLLQRHPGLRGALSDAEATAGRKFYLPKCLCVSSTWPFVEQLREVLCQIYRISIQPAALPIERYMCNFIDDVPAPVPGLVDVSYFCGVDAMTEVHFRCPPADQPRAWSGLPLRPLFECLSAPSVQELVAAVLAERRVLFVSSQLSLLTHCAEAATSLLYPLSWPHVYVPVLPRALLGMVSAPVPFIVGLHCSFMAEARAFCCGRLDALVVFLDEDRLEHGAGDGDGEGGEGGAATCPAPLPRRTALRLAELLAQVGMGAYLARGSRWSEVALPLYDSAFGNAATPAVVAAADEAEEDARCGDGLEAVSQARPRFSELALRRGFMALFVELLLNYRRHLAYAAGTGPGSGKAWRRFRVDGFLAEHPAESQPFLREFLRSQAFAQFVSERVALPESFAGSTAPAGNANAGAGDLFTDGHLDSLFFEEQLDMRLGRGAVRRFLSDRLDRIDSPALGRIGMGASAGAGAGAGGSRGGVKTYVPPSPEAAGLPARVYSYDSFPRLDAELFAPVREVNLLSAARNQTVRARGFARLARYGYGASGAQQTERSPGGGGGGAAVGLGPGPDGTRGEACSVMGCAYSCYLTILCSAITKACSNPPAPPTPPPADGPGADSGEEDGGADLFQYYNMERDSLSASDGEEELASDREAEAPGSAGGVAPADYSYTYRPMLPPCSCPGTADQRCAACAEEAAPALLRVAVEALNVLSARDEAPSDHVYRSLALASGACGDVIAGLSLLTHMRGEDVVPDFTVLSAVAGAIARHNGRVLACLEAARRRPEWVDRHLQLQSLAVGTRMGSGGSSNPARSRSVSASASGAGTGSAELWTMLYGARMNPADVWAVPALSQERGPLFEPGAAPRRNTGPPTPAPVGTPGAEPPPPPMWHDLLAQAYEEEKQCYALWNILRTFSDSEANETDMPTRGRLLEPRPAARRRARLTRQFSKLVGPGSGGGGGGNGRSPSPATVTPPPAPVAPPHVDSAVGEGLAVDTCGAPAAGAVATAVADLKAKAVSLWRGRSASADPAADGSDGERESARSSSPMDLPAALGPAASHRPRQPAAHEVQWSWAGTSPVVHLYPPSKRAGAEPGAGDDVQREARLRTARDALEIRTHERLERDSQRARQALFADTVLSRSGNVLAKLGFRPDPGDRKLTYCPDTDPKVSFAASHEFSPLVRESDKYTELLFPNLVIDFTHPLCTCCPAEGCGQRQTVEHVQSGWEPRDSSNYASRCWACRSAYVPQFTVFCTLHNFWWKGIGTDLGLTNFNAVAAGAGDGENCLWCPLLSPWVLMKEVQNVLCGAAEGQGVSALLAYGFVASSQQNAVVFWNLLVTFRRFGLPYSVLLCNNSLCSLFNSEIFMNNLPGRLTVDDAVPR